MARRRKPAADEVQPNPEERPAGTVPLYTVGPITDATMIGPSGGYVRSKRVHYVLADGTGSFVEVPLTDFNRANVQKLIDAAVETHLDVATIQGAPVPQAY